MTLGTVEIEKVQKYLENPGKGLDALNLAFAQTDQKESPVSGKTLARRLKGLLSKEKAEHLEQQVNESCEQIDD